MSDQDGAPSDPEEKPAETFTPLDAMTRVVRDKGRWKVMLNVPSWEPNDDQHPVANNWKLINDYATEAEANLAASWIERSANRTIRPPTGF
jgi:hypothetical protein